MNFLRDSLYVFLLSSLTACSVVGSPTPEVMQAQVVTALPQAPSIPNKSVTVSSYGALPDDSKDDTQAIQKAIDALRSQGGGSVLFPPGRYDISIQATTSCAPSPTSSACRAHRQALVLYPKLRLAPSQAQGATLRLADNQGDYESILATSEYWFTLDDFVLEGLTLDGNGQNNPVTRNAGSDPCCENTPDFGTPYAQTPRIMMRVYTGNRIKINRASFLNLTGLWAVGVNGDGPTVNDVDITNSTFTAGSNVADFDHSTIYSNSTRARIANNTFRSWYGAGTKGARTALEIHGVDQTITGNKVYGFTYGANIVGDGKLPGNRQLYASNTFYDVSTGFMIWSMLEGFRTVADKTLSDVELRGNRVYLNLLDWFNAPLSFEVQEGAGIRLEPNNDAPVDNLVIQNNTLYFGFSKLSQAASNYYQTRSSGMTFDLVKAPSTPIRGLSISGNVMTSSLGPGIFLSVPLFNALIENNTITNSVRGNELRYAEATPSRAGIYIPAQTDTPTPVAVVSSNVQIKNNTLRDTGTSVKLTYGVSVLSRCELACSLGGNTVEPAGLQLYNRSDSWSQP